MVSSSVQNFAGFSSVGGAEERGWHFRPRGEGGGVDLSSARGMSMEEQAEDATDEARRCIVLKEALHIVGVAEVGRVDENKVALAKMERWWNRVFGDVKAVKYAIPTGE